jgi:hypothetical protein
MGDNNSSWTMERVARMILCETKKFKFLVVKITTIVNFQRFFNPLERYIIWKKSKLSVMRVTQRSLSYENLFNRHPRDLLWRCRRSPSPTACQRQAPPTQWAIPFTTLKRPPNHGIQGSHRRLRRPSHRDESPPPIGRRDVE